MNMRSILKVFWKKDMIFENQAYIEFLCYSLNERQIINKRAKSIDWMEMMSWAEKQAIAGIIYMGIQKAGKTLNVPFDDLMEWIGYASQIETQNKLLNDRCVKVVKMFEDAGFKCCILKGQGNAMMYPNPLWRTPGDIDVYVTQKEQKSQKEIVQYVRDKNPGARAIYHHIDLGIVDGVEVEVHYRPSYMNNLIYNRRLQRWFKMNTDSTSLTDLPDGVGEIPVPSWEFNVVFQLCHIYQHVIKEGIGLRQIIDYYYLLKNEEYRVNSEEFAAAIRHTLDYLGLMQITGAVMWVLKEVLGLEKKYLITPVDERRGRFLLSEIMRGGNFGMYGTQKALSHFVLQKEQKEKRVSKAILAVRKNIWRLRRDARLVRYFPSECLWEPIFRVYHFGWRLVH